VGYVRYQGKMRRRGLKDLFYTGLITSMSITGTTQDSCRLFSTGALAIRFKHVSVFLLDINYYDK
jgi:hypothetical protein